VVAAQLGERVGPRWLPPAYRPLARSRAYRRLALGDFVSSIGDGMSAVAIAWQALLLAGDGSRGLAVGASLAAYTLPGIVTGLALGSRMAGVPSKWLIVLDGVTRACALGASVLLAWAGMLDLVSFVLLLSASSLFHAWGVAGRRSWVVDLVSEPHRLAANALLLTQQHVAYVVGPAIAGVVSNLWSPAAAIALDALSFAILVAAVWGVPARRPARLPGGGGVLRSLGRYPRIAALLALTCIFYFLYGPVEVALPLLVRGRLEGNAATLGMLWTFYGVGAVAGGLVTPLLRSVRLWVVVPGIVGGWGVGMIVLGMADGFAAAALTMSLSGIVFGPYAAVCATALQEAAGRRDLVPVSAAWASLVVAATPLGSAAGGPLVQGFGAASTILGSGVLTLGLAVGLAAATAILRRARGAAGTDAAGPVAGRAPGKGRDP
jgi:MFS family permease